MISEETVTDNLVHGTHDCQVGAGAQSCALVKILGRVAIGDGADTGPSAVTLNGTRV
jgi:serine acetyltransferase